MTARVKAVCTICKRPVALTISGGFYRTGGTR
jgi:hypothetical protein